MNWRKRYQPIKIPKPNVRWFAGDEPPDCDWKVIYGDGGENST